MIKTNFSKSIRYFRSDSGGEYMSKAFHKLIISKGIIYKTYSPYTPEEKSVVELKHGHLVKKSWHSFTFFWCCFNLLGEAILIVAYLISTPLISLLVCPSYNSLFQQCSNYSSFRDSGYTCFILVLTTKCTNLSAHSCRFLRYEIGEKSYQCCDPISLK